MGILSYTGKHSDVIMSENIEREIKIAMREIRIANRSYPQRVKLVSWRLWLDGTCTKLEIVYTDGDGKTESYNVAM